MIHHTHNHHLFQLHTTSSRPVAPVRYAEVRRPFGLKKRQALPIGRGGVNPGSGRRRASGGAAQTRGRGAAERRQWGDEQSSGHLRRTRPTAAMRTGAHGPRLACAARSVPGIEGGLWPPSGSQAIAGGSRRRSSPMSPRQSPTPRRLEDGTSRRLRDGRTHAAGRRREPAGPIDPDMLTGALAESTRAPCPAAAESPGTDDGRLLAVDRRASTGLGEAGVLRGRQESLTIPRRRTLRMVSDCRRFGQRQLKWTDAAQRETDWISRLYAFSCSRRCRDTCAPRQARRR
jgi:hypothetical protein